MAGVAVEEEGTAALVARARAGDGAAFGRLYDLHADDVQRVVLGMRLGLSRDEVEDAVQETFLRVLRDLRRVDAGRALRPFVLGVARHVAIDRCRRARVRAAAPLDPAAPDGAPPVPEQAAGAERARLLDEALGALGPELRAALTLRHVRDVSMEELADALDCSVPTARARLREAAAALGVELRRRGLSPREEGRS